MVEAAHKGEFLLELFSEEIPARMQTRAANDLARLAKEKLNAASLEYGALETHVTPRRLVLVVRGLPEKQPDISEEKKGPKVDAPEKAVQGFLRSSGLDTIEQAQQWETDKGTFLFAVRTIHGRETKEVLAEIVSELIREMPWPKSMRWGTQSFRYVRPLHEILAMFDGAVVQGEFDLGGRILDFARVTRGHRFLSPEPFAVTSFADYHGQLFASKVMLEQAARRKSILEQGEALAKNAGLRLKDDPGLLDEIVGLVEWPAVLMGTIEPEFMELPPEVLTVSMRTHQKYFALENRDGSMANRFLAVANIETSDGGAAIVAGNERVLRARLSDARFFWTQDRKESLADRVPRLQDVIFHAKLGSLHHKVDRIEALAVRMADFIKGAERDQARSAAVLCKTDLTTGMVGEFPELQGVMGRYYALADGEDPQVAQAIADHYAPQGPKDHCPSAPVSAAVALADKLDTLTGFFAVGEKPTGSKDPYALRRAGLGVIRLIVENGLRIPLTPLLREALHLQPEAAVQELRSRLAAGGQKAARGTSAADSVPHAEDALSTDVLEFLTDRLKVVLRDRGVRHDLISAVFAVGQPGGGAEDDLVRLLARVDALERFLKSEDGANLLTAYRRAANIVRIEEKKDKTIYYGAVEEKALQAVEEQALHAALKDTAKQAKKALGEEDFTSAMAAMAELRKPLDVFFDTVTVNADDPALRENRLRLLKQIDTTLAQVADFSRIEG